MKKAPKKPTKKKAPNQEQLRKQCDTLMQEIGRLINPWCILCGKPCQVMHHFLPKSVCAKLRYDWDNLCPLCNGCHMRLHQSGDPSYEQRIIDFYGKPWYDNLQELRKESIRVNIGYYKQIQSELLKLRVEINSANLSSNR